MFDTNAARQAIADNGVNDFWNPARIYSFAGNWNERMSAQVLDGSYRQSSAGSSGRNGRIREAWKFDGRPRSDAG